MIPMLKVETMLKVEINWVDSMGGFGWKSPDHMDDCDIRIQTIGWLVNETKDAYIVSTSVCLDNGDVHAPFKIPKVAVTGIWEITC